MIKLIKKLLSKAHIHSWKTTHTNQWMHPTRIVCSGCGGVRVVKFKPNKDEINGMPWKLVDWVDEKGNRFPYKTSDGDI